MTNVSLNNVGKKYGETEVIKDVSLEVKGGELVVFLGPSGSGKSTLLRMIAGLEDITSGSIAIDNQEISNTHPAKRGIAMVFQSYALYPHMSVYNNMAFALKLAKMPKGEIDEKVKQAAEILQIAPLLYRLPKQLSGGQRQRVAIGRAIVRDPKVFLFDEPLSNLDAALRVQTRVEIEKLHKQLNTTIIYVTHDQVEAMTLADRVVILNGGNIEQMDTPSQIYNSPANLFVAGFIGNSKMNFYPIKGAGSKAVSLGGKKKLNLQATLSKGIDYTLGIRPEHFRLVSEKDSLLSGKVEICEQLGEYSMVYVKLKNGQSATVKDGSARTHASGSTVHLSVKPELCHLFGENGKKVE